MRQCKKLESALWGGPLGPCLAGASTHVIFVTQEFITTAVGPPGEPAKFNEEMILSPSLKELVLDPS